MEQNALLLNLSVSQSARSTESMHRSSTGGSASMAPGRSESSSVRREFASSSRFTRVYRHVAAQNESAQKSVSTRSERETAEAMRAVSRQAAHSRHVDHRQENPVKQDTPVKQKGIQVESDKQSGVAADAPAPVHAQEATTASIMQHAAVKEAMNAAHKAALQMKEAPTAMDQATAVIKQSLITVSHELDLNLAGDLSELKLDKPNEGLIEQFAEMVAVMQSMAQIMAQAADAQQPIEINGRTFDGPQLAQAEKLLRVEVFNMQIGFKMLGISQEVALGVADKQGIALDVGLMQATDPSKLATPMQHLEQFFSHLMQSQQEELQDIYRKVVAFAKGFAGPQQEAAVPALTPETTVSQVSGLVATELKAPFAAAYDTALLRQMLKLDVKQTNATSQTGGDVSIARIDAVKSWQAIWTVNPNEAILRMDEQGLPVMDVLSKSGGYDALSAVLGQKNVDTVFKNIEKAVMNQILNQVTTALKTGLNEVRLTLRPESMGEVKLKIRIQEEIVVARINVENTQVKAIVESNLPQLRDALTEHNLRMGSFQVSVDNGSAEEGSHQSTDREGKAHGAVVHDSQSREPLEAAESAVAAGSDTGRRYGNNTVEYFA
ncbi:MAG: hypothetical protein GF398_10760 [Chitinivibrionales bacterium]|nr:hypothetical protein [Chitinivibrionales bacterium]